MKKAEMLLIGSAGQNCGKTLLACSIIKRFSPQYPMIGIKVSTIHEKSEKCAQECREGGASSRIEWPFCITEELNSGSGKDTSRLLAAGARKVFWLLVVEGKIEAGLAALFKQIPPKTMLVCESNSVRTVLKPGVFLIMKEKKQRDFKPSAREVRNLADRIVEFDSTKLKMDEMGAQVLDGAFDFELDDLAISEGKWILRSPEAHS